MHWLLVHLSIPQALCGELNTLSSDLLEDVEALEEPLLQVRLHLATLSHLGEALQLLLVGSSIHALALLNESLLLVGAPLRGLDDALHFEGLLNELLQRVEIATAFVVLALTVQPVLDRWVAFHVVLAAQVLVHGAVHVHDSDRGRAGVFVAKLVISRFHGLAVASPGSEKLHERVFAAVQYLSIEIR